MAIQYRFNSAVLRFLLILMRMLHLRDFVAINTSVQLCLLMGVSHS
jgi:hypothetical protein